MSVSGINSLLNNLIAKYSGQQSSSESKTTTTSTDSSGDTVTLSARLKELQSQAILNAEASLLGAGSEDSQDSIVSVMLGNQDSADAMTSLLMDAANARMMKANPKLVEELLAQKESTATTSESKSEGSEIENIKTINLFSLNTDTIKALLKQNSESTSPKSSTTSGTTKVV